MDYHIKNLVKVEEYYISSPSQIKFQGDIFICYDQLVYEIHVIDQK